MSVYTILVAFENYRVGQLVFVDGPQERWLGLEKSGYVKQAAAITLDAPVDLARVDEFLNSPESGVKVKRPRKRKEVGDGTDQVEPGPGPSDGQEQGLD
jgi:hypothetical protein